MAWLAVRAGGYNYLFPLGQSGEIFPVTTIQSVPYAQDWFRGVLNIRGGLYGIVDLCAFVASVGGQARLEPPAVDPSVVTLNTALEVNCALQVDALAGLRGADAFTASAPAPEGAPAFFGNRFTDASGQSWQEINLRSLSLSPQFLSISA